MSWRNMLGTDHYIEQLPKDAIINGKKGRLRIKLATPTQWLTRYIHGSAPNYKVLLEVKSKNLNHGAKIMLKLLSKQKTE